MTGYRNDTTAPIRVGGPVVASPRPRRAQDTSGEPSAFGVQAARLLSAVDEDPWGNVRPSLYETARVMSWAPWLHGHGRRTTWVLEQQAADGSWGEGPAPYRLLPTLSAVEAVLATLLHTIVPDQEADRLAAAASAGLAAVRDLSPAGPWPDTAAAEILVPVLVSRINEHLDHAGARSFTSLGPWCRGPRLDVPAGYHISVPEKVASRCSAAGGIPLKLHHTYEGIARYVPPALSPTPDGLLGSSPAATAAWAAGEPSSRAVREAAVAELNAVAERYGGLFPEAAPITVFERLWVAAALAGPGIPASAWPTIRNWVDRIYDPEGVRGAPGLMPDADDTAMAVLVAALADRPRDPAPLAVFENQNRYDCYVGEDTGSVTANAHALQALGGCLRHRPDTEVTYGPRIRGVRDWLLDQQHRDGRWEDKWHASPYYATERCVTGLAGCDDDRARNAVRAAAEWAAETQHGDGSWGVWGGTAEETAYAVNILLCLPAPMRQAHHDSALADAEAFLREFESDLPHPALWHDKTLYAPQAMVEAEVLAAREKLRRHGAAEQAQDYMYMTMGRADA